MTLIPLLGLFGEDLMLRIWEDMGVSPYTVDRYVSMMKKSADLLVP